MQFARNEPIESLGAAPTVTDAAFRTRLGALSEVMDTPQQAFVIIRPEERRPVDSAGLTQETQTLRERVLGYKQNAHLTQWLAELRTRAKLKSFVEATGVTPG